MKKNNSVTHNTSLAIIFLMLFAMTFSTISHACAGGDVDCGNCVIFEPVLSPYSDTRAVLAGLLFKPENESYLIEATAEFATGATLKFGQNTYQYVDRMQNIRGKTAPEFLQEQFVAWQWDPAESDKVSTLFTDKNVYTLANQYVLAKPVLDNINSNDNNTLTPAEKIALTCMSLDVSCGDVSQGESKEFTDYLTARKAFHAADYPTAAQGFTALSTAKSGWVKETSLYNLIRVYLRQSLPENQYGSVDFSRQDTASATLALQAINNYLQQYPDGRYAASASGLKRRAYWLQNDLDALAASYYPALQFMQQHQADGDSNGLINEMDRYVLFPPQLMVANNTATPNEKPACRVAWNVPPIAATQVMLCLRDDGPMKPVPVSELLTHENAFQDAGYGDAFRLLLLTNSFYSEKNYQKVVDSTQDWQTLTTQSSYAAYSILALRAFALESLSQWQDSQALWNTLRQMNASPLFHNYTGIAQVADLEIADNLEAVFAKDSPVSSIVLRSSIVNYSASASILQYILAQDHIQAEEKQRALSVLLRKEMVAQNYHDFAAHYKQYKALLPEPMSWCTSYATGEQTDYECKNPETAISNLASDHVSSDTRLCLTVWLNQCGGVAHSRELNKESPRSLAGVHIQPGNYARDNVGGQFSASAANLYGKVLDDPQATPDQRAYALYSSLQCFYHNDNSHSYGYCPGLGNHEDFPIQKREAWFRELKKKYGKSKWAKAQRVYW